jgi:hypothetical protein
MKSLIPRTYRKVHLRPTPTTKIQRIRHWGSWSLVAVVVGLALTISGGVSPTPTTSATAAIDLNPFHIVGKVVCDWTNIGSTPSVSPWPGVIGFGAKVGRDTSAVVANEVALNGRKIYNIEKNYVTPYAKQIPPLTAVTAYEYYGTAGQFWNTEHYNELGAACLPFIPAAGNMIAGIVFTIDQVAAEIGLTIYGWAMSIDAFGPFLNTIDRIFVGSPTEPNGGLVHKLFLNYMAPIVLAGALWMAWQGLVKKRSKNAIQGAVWMLGSATASLIFLLHPTAIAGTLNQGINYVITDIISAEAEAGSVASVDAGGGTGQAIDICYLPYSSPGRGWRMAQCTIWRAFVYTPWANGQFGSTVDTYIPAPGSPASKADPTAPTAVPVTIPGHAANSNIALIYLDAHVYNHDQAVVTANPQVQKDRIEAKRLANMAVVNSLIKLQDANGLPSTASFTGDNWSGRISIAFVDLVAMFAALIPVMTLTFSLITLQLGLVFLLMLAPIFLTFGIHPGFGRRLTMSWLEMVVSNSLKRIGNAFLLGILLLLFEVITGIGGAWIIQVVLLVAASIGFMSYKGKILKGFHINLGGSSDQGDIAPFKQVGSKLGSGIAAFARDGASYEGGRLAGGINGLWGRNKHTRQFRALGKEVREHKDPLRVLEKKKTVAQKERQEQLREDSLMDNTDMGEMAIWQKNYDKTGKPISRPVDPQKAEWLEQANIPMRERVIRSAQKDTVSSQPVAGGGNIPTPLGGNSEDNGKVVNELGQTRETLQAERKDLAQRYAESKETLTGIENSAGQFRVDSQGGIVDGTVARAMADKLRRDMSDMSNRAIEIDRTLKEMDEGLIADDEHPSVRRPVQVVEIPAVLSSRYGSPENVPPTESVTIENFEVPLTPRRPKDTNESHSQPRRPSPSPRPEE